MEVASVRRSMLFTAIAGIAVATTTTAGPSAPPSMAPQAVARYEAAAAKYRDATNSFGKAPREGLVSNAAQRKATNARFAPWCKEVEAFAAVMRTFAADYEAEARAAGRSAEAARASLRGMRESAGLERMEKRLALESQLCTVQPKLIAMLDENDVTFTDEGATMAGTLTEEEAKRFQELHQEHQRILAELAPLVGREPTPAKSR